MKLYSAADRGRRRSSRQSDRGAMGGLSALAVNRRRLHFEPLEPRRMLAGPVIDHVDPLPGVHTAPPDTDVSAVYDQAIDPNSVSDATFAVHAMQTGQLLQPESPISVDGDTITLDPAADFFPGELIQATATTGIENPSGQPSADPFVWQFRTEVTAGSGVFAYSGQDLGQYMPPVSDIALGDLDGDGDFDAFVRHKFTTGNEPNTVWLNDGQGHFIDSGQRLSGEGSGSDGRVSLGDLDGDGRLVPKQA